MAINVLQYFSEVFSAMMSWLFSIWINKGVKSLIPSGLFQVQKNDRLPKTFSGLVDSTYPVPNNECIFTGTLHPEAAHIFPYGALRHREFNTYKDLLRTFWGEEQAKIWLDSVQNTSVTEPARNLISLNHQIHWWFDNGNMALKPLRQLHDGSVVVQFHWLKRHQIKLTTEFKGSTNDFMQNAGLEDNSAWGEILAHKESGLPLTTGQVFTLKADKAELVPSFELLKLSWDMLRIIAISGAAEPKELWKEDDCDSNAWFSQVSIRLRSWMDQTEDGEHDNVDSRG